MEEEEVEEGLFRTTNGAIVKGKRTKRLRLQSPFVFEANNNNNNDNNNVFVDEDYCPSRDGDREKPDDGVKFFPGSSSERIEENVGGADREEEDMARCLILPAQGQSRDFGNEVDYRHHPSNVDRRELFDQEDQKFNSKRYLEATTGAGKIGYYVYKCKTCNRTFPSFQALGGYRASHKKPKVVVTGVKRQFVPSPLILDNAEEASAARFVRGGGNISLAPALSLQLTTSQNTYSGKYSNNNNRKVHECAICATEFSSGQALVGHMRRHRAPAGPSLGLSLRLVATLLGSEGLPMRIRTLVSLDLDLNLPAPEATGDNNVTSHDAPQTKQQQDQVRLVFSVPALVDCHF